MVLEMIVKMISSQLKVEEQEISRDSRLVEDLGADSASIMVLIMDLEDHYNMQVEDSAITALKTVGDIADYIKARVG